MFVTTDNSGNITYASQAFCELTGYSKNYFEESSPPLYLSKNVSIHCEVYQTYTQTFQTNTNWTGEIQGSTKQNKTYCVTCNIEPILENDGRVDSYIAIMQNITANKKLQKLVITDELTGAYNRRYYNQILPQEISRCKREKNWLAVLMIDADHFKKYNDTYGHQAGDDALVLLTQTMQSCFRRPGDFIFRLGGEEFAAVYSVTNPEDADMLAEKVRAAVYNLNLNHSGNAAFGRFTISLGLMLIDPEGFYVEEEIYKYADEALYKAKEAGRNRVEKRSHDDDIELF